MYSFLNLFDPTQSDDGFEDEDLQNGNIIDSANSSNSSSNSSISCSSECDLDNQNQNNQTNKTQSQSTTKASNKTKIVIDFEQGMLPPEPQLGNIEYKLKLINPSKQRFEHLVTQMKWRLREGHGEAIYEIGVADSGHLQGLNEKDMSISLTTLNLMAQKLGASTSILRRKYLIGRNSVTEVGLICFKIIFFL